MQTGVVPKSQSSTPKAQLYELHETGSIFAEIQFVYVESHHLKATFITNMTCGGCLEKVSPYLEAEPTVLGWEADFSDAAKLLHVELESADSADQVIHAIQQAGFSATVQAAPTGVELNVVEPEKPKFRLSTYQPLFLVVVYVFGAAFLMESVRPSWQWSRLMTSFMGFFFLGFAFFKLLNISKFADAFASYDILAKRSRVYGLTYPWIEVVIGLLFVTQTWLPLANVATIIAMSVGLMGVVSAVRNEQAIQCACLGTAFNLPMSVVTIIENAVMLIMAIAMLVTQLGSQ